MTAHGDFGDSVHSLAYDELRRIATALRRRDPYSTLTTTSLVAEAWLKLMAARPRHVESDQHLRHIVVRAMRQVLVDSARRRRASKRMGVHVELDAADVDIAVGSDEQVLALHDQLERFSQVYPRAASVVEARFFGGLDVRETAELLGIAEITVARDWRLARAWLRVGLEG